MINEQVFKLKKDSTPKYNCLCKTPELIENYDKAVTDTNQTWECHHRLETHTSDGERRLVDLSHKELKALGMYYDRPPEELIFLTISEHTSLHHKGKHISDESRKKMSGSQKRRFQSEDSRKKMSESLKGKLAWTSVRRNQEEII